MVKVAMVNRCVSEIRDNEDDQEVHKVHLEVDSRHPVMLPMQKGHFAFKDKEG